MDELFGPNNFIADIVFQKTGSQSGDFVQTINDYVCWYVKDAKAAAQKFRPLFLAREERDEADFSPDPLTSAGETQGSTFDFKFQDRTFHPGKGAHWKTTREGMERLADVGRIVAQEGMIRFKRFWQDFPVKPLSNVWSDVGGARGMVYVVQTNTKIVQRCLLMTTDPGDLVFDPTCGSGTTAAVAEEWGRRWITCDTSRVATTLAKQRLMGVTFDYYKLAHPNEGVGSGFEYKKVPHVTLKSIANNEPSGEETLYDQPLVDNSRARISGPFTVEAVPAPNVKSIDELDAKPQSLAEFRHAATPLLDASIARSGPTIRQSDWRDELLKTGIRGKGGQMINFSRVEPLGGTRWLHADAETKGAKPERVVISFGPDYAPLETRQVESAWEEARTLHPKPEILVFAAFQFDPEAAKDIDELTKEKTGMTFLTAQMNADLLTDDLKKKRTSNQSFWLVGRPDVDLRQIKSGDNKGKYQAEVRGFDYFNTRTGSIESGDTSKIAMWLLDTDYDGRSLYPRQVFFPLANEDEGWAKLARNLKAEIDPELIEHYRGTVSLPFALGEHKRVAVKVIDDRGIESLKVLQV